MRRWQKILLSSISLIFIILFAAASILPDIIRNKAIERVRKDYNRAKFPKPRNALGVQKKLPAAEMEKLILANLLVGTEEMQGLAKARAAAIQKELILKNPDLKPRIFLKNTDINKPAAKDKNPARVEFGIAAG